MSNGGFSKTRLSRMADVMSGFVERGDVPGVVTALSRRGEVHVEAFGSLAKDGAVPMKRDTIFRIASMTKPVVAVAAMILVEECRLRLDDPVDFFLPELADRKVLRTLESEVADVVPANRAITLRDLLTFRLGYGAVMAMPGTYPIQKAVQDLFGPPGPPDAATTPAPDEWMRRLGTLPLVHQPGERWLYHTGSDVLGVLIARASGKSLDVFLKERIFDPLGMRDTGFSVPQEKIDRLATSYWTKWDTGANEVFDEAKGGNWSRPPVFPSGGGGLVSTADDYLAFAHMMLNKGKAGSERILSRPSVETMTTNQIRSEQKAGSEMFFDDNRGWGFGVSVFTRRDNTYSVPGRYGWDGGLGTSWYADPAEELTGILLTQQAWTSPVPPKICQDFWTTAYQSIDG